MMSILREWYNNLFGEDDDDDKKSCSNNSDDDTEEPDKNKEPEPNPFNEINLKRYPRYKEIQCWLKKLPQAYPDRVKVEKIGQSIEKRPIFMVILKGCSDLPKISVMVEAGIHAREWLSLTTALYFVNYFVQNPQELNFVDLYIIPCLNPDGYEYSHTTDRLWRKNMNKNGFKRSANWGVDLNRNFPFGYAQPGSSPCPNSFMFRGKHSLSEPEAQSLANVLNKYGKYIQLYLALHCFGNLIMYPWGYTLEKPCDENDLKNCAEAGIVAMRDHFPRSNFEVGGFSQRMFLSSGGTSDFARGMHNIKFSYTIELPKFGESGFEAHPSKITKVARHTYVGVKAMIEHVYQFYTASSRKREHGNTQVFCNDCKRFRTR